MNKKERINSIKNELNSIDLTLGTYNPKIEELLNELTKLKNELDEEVTNGLQE